MLNNELTYSLILTMIQLADPKYTDNGAIFDIMAYTVVEQGIELAMAA